ncbi:extracellular solute-binding protein [Neisseriaceae bacterium JH1-16]|nr:extracellular solute-binding protein [Neisseriaceae bacterium JH1-16]
MQTKKHIAALALALAGAWVHAAEPQVVNVYAWDGYVPPEVAAQFTKETGIQVRVAALDSNDTLQAKLLAGHSGYDLVMPSVAYVGKQIAAGAYLPLDHAQLPNLHHLDPTMLEKIAKVDPGQHYTLPYMTGTNGLGINDTKVKAALGNTPLPKNLLELVFNPSYASKVAKCGVTLLDSGLDTLSIALVYLNKSPLSTSTSDLEAATQLLIKTRPYVTKFTSSDYINGLASGDYCVSYGWSGDIASAVRSASAAGNGVKLRYWLPEHTVLWFDTLAIPKDAPHTKNAYQLINFLLRPDIAARVSNGVNLMNTNRDSKSLLSKELRDSPDLNPFGDRLNSLSITRSYEASTQRTITRNFQRVKTSQ